VCGRCPAACGARSSGARGISPALVTGRGASPVGVYSPDGDSPYVVADFFSPKLLTYTQALPAP
jgi:hypothetical protein